MTVRQMREMLAKLPEEAQDLPMYGIDGASGVSMSIGNAFVRKQGWRARHIEAGDVLELPPFAPFVEVYLGN